MRRGALLLRVRPSVRPLPRMCEAGGRPPGFLDPRPPDPPPRRPGATGSEKPEIGGGARCSDGRTDGRTDDGRENEVR